MSESSSYRRDIDGLRAFSILAVVGFHAFPSRFKGGFVGVDIFFVISGYLISGLLFDQLAENRLSLARFYSHRVKRIFPALSLVLCASLLLGWVILLPDEFAQLGRHLFASSLFFQNIVLWKEAGYFDVESSVKPLLHLWSLSIEEQFYLIYPIIIILFYKLKINILYVLGLIFLFSFVLNVFDIKSDPSQAFFSPQTRVWELDVGAILAYLTKRSSFGLRRPSAAHLCSVIGFAAAVFSVVSFGSAHPYPGWRALVPVLAAALLIAAGPDALLNKAILARRLPVAIGLISYPLYLWHWPLLSFAYIVTSGTLSRAIRLEAVALSILLAALTFTLIERPIRFRTTANAILPCLVLLVAGLGGSGWLVERAGGLEQRSVVRMNPLASSGQVTDMPLPIVPACGLTDVNDQT